MKHKICIPGPDRKLGINFVMIVEADTSASIKDDADLIKCLRNGITDWAKESEAGKRCYAYSGDDMNIGDLASMDTEEIVAYCKGINSISIEQIEVSNHWTYDTRLCDTIEENNG
jgi:hypothetical protein